MAEADTGPWPSQLDADELARRVVLLSALEKRVSEQRDALKDELRTRQLLRPGNTIRPRLSDGEPAGRVTFTTGRVSAKVTDMLALAQWCVTQGYRDAVEYRPTVLEDFVAKLLEVSKVAEQPLGPGGEAGEYAPKGVAVVIGQGSVSATPDMDRATELWHDIRASLFGAHPLLEELEQ